MRSRLSSSTILLILKCVCVYNFPAKRFIKSGKIQIARGSLNKAKQKIIYIFENHLQQKCQNFETSQISQSYFGMSEIQKKKKKKFLSFVFETTS